MVRHRAYKSQTDTICLSLEQQNIDRAKCRAWEDIYLIVRTLQTKIISCLWFFYNVLCGFCYWGLEAIETMERIEKDNQRKRKREKERDRGREMEKE